MPIFTPGSNTPNCSGRKSSAVFQTTANGRIIRARVKPIRRISGISSKSRSNLLAVASNWRNLSPSEQSEWNALAETFPQYDSCGNEYYLSGQQLFIKGNQSRVAEGEAIQPVAPLEITNPEALIEEVTVTPGLNIMRFIVDPPNVPDDQYYKYYASAAVSAGLSSVAPGAYKIVGNTDEGDETDINVINQWLALYGPLSGLSGLKIFFRLIAQDKPSGIQGVPSYSSTIIP